MWSKTTALGTTTGSGTLSLLTILLLVVGAGEDKIIVWLGWGQAASWLGAVNRLLGDIDAGTTPTEEELHCSPPGGKHGATLGLHAWSC